MDLSVIVVTHNGRAMALETLRSARECAGALEAEWFVVDSGSTDGTPDAIEAEFGDVRVFRRPNIGFAAGNNVALSQARGRYVLLLNPDVVVERGTFADVVRALDERPEIGLASVIQLLPDGSVHPTIRRFPTPATKFGEAVCAERIPFGRALNERETRAAEYHRKRPADWVVGAFMMARREAVADVGGLDERFFLYSEEIDWCRRFHDAGWEVWHLPVMEVVHFGAHRPRPELVAQLSHAKVLYATKHQNGVRRELVRLALMLRHGLRLLAFGPLAAVRPHLRQRARGEAMGLAVCMGLRPPPFAPAKPPGA